MSTESQIILIWNPRDLQTVMNTEMNLAAELKVLNLSGESLPVEKDGFFQLLEASDLICQDSTAFLQDYRDLMGRLSTHVHSRLWWATYIASKNRFASRIPILLQQVEACAIAIATCSGNLIIYKPELSITSTLVNHCSQTGVTLSFPKWHLRYRLFIQRSWSYASLMKSCLDLIYRLVVVRLFYKPEPDQDSNHKVTVLKSFFYESSIDEKEGYSYKDPIFGRLPDFVADRNKLLILTHVLGRYRSCIKKINREKNFTIVPVEYWLSIKSILSSLYDVLTCRLDKKMPDVMDYRGISVSGIFRDELYRKYNDIPLMQLVFYPLMKACCKSRKIQKYIHTYENNPWEKMAIAGIQEVTPYTRTTGFQQSVVTQASVNTFNSSEELANMPMPQRILCVGQKPLDIINIYCESTLTNAETSCGLRYKYLQQFELKPRRKIQKILVAPEGVPSVVPMLNYVLDQLKNRQEYQLTFRFHPALTYDTVRAKFGFDLGTDANANISKVLLEEDLMNHDLCIYWGSTVALEALCMGIPLIHYDMQTVLSYDPLFRCDYLKWTVTDNESLPEVIETINSLTDEEYTRQADQAAAYIKGYFYPVTDENMLKFLDN